MSERLIDDVRQFNELNGADLSKFNVRSVGLYKGLQLEELIEGLDAIFAKHVFHNSAGQLVPSYEHDTLVRMKELCDGFKKGYYDNLIQNVDRVELLDSDIDSVYVAIGAALSSGADVQGAWNEIQNSNMSKANPDTGKMDKDANGKVIKGKNYFAPNIRPFVKD
jgi:predicted HAD superfamily Cof-like phosphohydrolase